MKKTTVWAIILLLIAGILSINLPAQNRYYYKMDNIQAEHYIEASRNEVKNNNLSLACLYARKAVQANSWSKKAWANYDDVVKRLINKGKVKDFTAPVATTPIAPPPTAQAQAPTPTSSDDSGSQFEGC